MGEIANLGLGAICGTDDYGNPVDCANLGINLAGQSVDPGGLSVGNTWTSIWQQGVVTAFGIANARYGGVQPGQYTQNGNRINYRVPTGSANFGTFPSGVGVGVGSGPLLTYALIGGAALLAISLLKK
jgi:hypothetical protein